MLKLNRKLLVTISLGLGLGAFAGCRGKDSKIVGEESDLMYGFLNNRTASLLALKPSDKILVCGTSTENLQELAYVSVKKWAEASGRADLVVERSDSCTQRRSYAGSISVAYDGPSCEGNVLGYHTQNGQHHDIVSCPLAKSNDGPATMLHEVGHAWGLCDQYAENNAAAITFNGNCQSNYRSAQAARSIMGGGYRNSPNGLTEDDFLGIRIGACRPDIASNTTWIKNNPEIVAEWKTAAFRAEVARIQKTGAAILPECVADATTPVPTKPTNPTTPTNPTPTTPTPTNPTPTTPVDGKVCDRLSQVVGVQDGFFFFWSSIRFALQGAAADLDQVASVQWYIHDSFPNTIKSTSRANNFATPSLYTSMSDWESLPARVTLKAGGTCDVKGTVVRL